jgi:hypothetical protein
MAYIQHPMFLTLLEDVDFDTSTGCWFGPDGTYFHGRAFWFLVFGWNWEDYRPSRVCTPRLAAGNLRPCISPFHVEKEWMMHLVIPAVSTVGRFHAREKQQKREAA